MMRQNHELVTKLTPEVGWLAPDGKYYPGERGGNWLHLEVAIAIMKAFYPDEMPKDEHDVTGMLYEKGYIRIDLKQVWPDGTFSTTERITQAQQATLYNLYLLRWLMSSETPEMIRRVLLRCGWSFLRKPGDDEREEAEQNPHFDWMEDA